MLDRLCSIIETIATQACWALIALLVTVVTINVFTRYGLQTGLLWAEEVSRLIFVWVVFLGSYLAWRRKAHMAIDLVWRASPPALRKVMTYFGGLSSLVFLGLVVYGGLLLLNIALEFGRSTPILRISAAWGYASVPVAAGFMFLELLNSLIKLVRTEKEGRA